MNFDKTETPPAAVLLEREEKASFRHYSCRARITGTPHGRAEGRTSQRLTAEETRATTAAPFHRFDGGIAIPHHHNTKITPSLFS
jgi:hypothetical protein